MKNNVLKTWVYSGLFLVAGAYVFDWFLQLEPCTLCLLQRFILCLSIIVMYFGSEISVLVLHLCGIGLIARHVYVLLFAPKAVSCLPLSLIKGIPYQFYPQFLIQWASHLGRQCQVEDPTLDLLFLGMLLAYYVIGVLLSSRVKIGLMLYERIRSN
ncbi:disulfide bond formation protein B [Gammaproteobacteria bacterium]|nr:disulfide bond formation protein B [Gammaproteobacteria bacterium]